MRLFHAIFFVAISLLLLNSWSLSARAAPDESGFALLVDIAEYRDTNIPSLQWKSGEVDKIKSALQLQGGFPESQIRMLTDEGATREGITESLTALVETARARPDARFFLYVKGRSLELQGRRYLLPYDARFGASSTYIEEREIDAWLNQLQIKKMLVQAVWDVSDQDDRDFSTSVAEILNNADTDSDGNRNVTLAEVTNQIRTLGFSREYGFSGDYPVRVYGDNEASVIRLASVIEVSSDPSGAVVLIDGVEKGTTPAQISGLAQGTHKLNVTKDRYGIPTEQTINIGSARGRKVIATPYQLIPIEVNGTIQGADKETMKDVSVKIQGTAYSQKTREDGSFSFSDWGTYGLLESGKNYEILAQSSDGLHSGSTSFVFSGNDNINLSISLIQSNWIQVADQHLISGDTDAATATLDAKLETSGNEELLQEGTFSGIRPALAQLFLTHLEDRLRPEPDNLKAHIVAAILADVTGDIPTARNHWKSVKAASVSGTQEHERASMRLRQTSSLRKPQVIALIVACIVVILAASVILGIYIRKRIRFSRFREIPMPYIAGKPIIERGMFFGREDVFSFIKEKFSHEAKDITIVLYGGRRTGKTSIMYQIRNGRLGEDFLPVFIDMQEMAGVDAHDFFRSIAHKVNEVHRTAIELSEDDRMQLNELYGNLEDKSKSVYQSFNNFLAGVSSTLEDKYIIFLIDEYEIIDRKIDEGNMTDEIFSYLRHLMQNLSNLAFIFSGSSDFGKQDREEWALTFNQAQPREVSFLSRENAVSLITEPVKDYIRYDRKAVERVLRITAGHPFFTQAICQEIIEDMNDRQQNKVTVEYVDEACRNIVENAPLHLAFLWSEFTNDEKIMVALLAELLTDGLAYIPIDEIISGQKQYELEYDRATVSMTLARLSGEHLVEIKAGTEEYRFRMDLIRAWSQSEHPIWGVLKEVQNSE